MKVRFVDARKQKAESGQRRSCNKHAPIAICRLCAQRRCIAVVGVADCVGGGSISNNGDLLIFSSCTLFRFTMYTMVRNKSARRHTTGDLSFVIIIVVFCMYVNIVEIKFVAAAVLLSGSDRDYIKLGYSHTLI